MQYTNALLYSGWRFFCADFLKGKLCFLLLYILTYNFILNLFYIIILSYCFFRFLKNIIEIGEKYSVETGHDPLSNSDCWAKLAILNGELKTAEAIYLEQNELNQALDMYQKYWHWEDALILAQNRGWSGLQELRDKHLTWLLESGQTARAAAILESTNPRRAVKLYLDARRPGRAARLALANDELLEDRSIVNEILKVLKITDLMELAGELLEKISEPLEAIKCYSQAGVFARALELSRKVDPTSVVELERDWGKHLVSAGHYDAAINHFIEAGETALALDAAINARQWRKGLQIMQVNISLTFSIFIKLKINIFIKYFFESN